MFLGRHIQKLDDKGRVSIPVAFRRVIQQTGAEQVILTSSKDLCLTVYTLEEWDALVAEWAARPSLDPELEAFERIYAANAYPTPVDRQGRILVPPTLRDYAQLERDVLFAGRLRKFEIWHPARWEDVMNRSAAILARTGKG